LNNVHTVMLPGKEGVRCQFLEITAALPTELEARPAILRGAGPRVHPRTDRRSRPGVRSKCAQPPDLDHADPIGPHYGWKTPSGVWNRTYPNGIVASK
jgi:hypothetical protein